MWRMTLALCLLAAPVNAEQVTIGTSASYPPMIVHNGAAPVSGLEGDLLSAICTQAGWTCTWEILPFDVIFPALEVGRIDIAANSFGYTAERAARVHMTCPHRPNGNDRMSGSFYVIDPTHDPFSGSVAVLRGSLHAIALAEAGVDARPFSADTTALDTVVAGEIPAYFGPDPAVEQYPNRAALFAVGEMAIRSGGTSFAVSPLRADLAAELDDQLANLSRAGTITQITRRWTGSSVDDPIALCENQPPIS